MTQYRAFIVNRSHFLVMRTTTGCMFSASQDYLNYYFFQLVYKMRKKHPYWSYSVS